MKLLEDANYVLNRTTCEKCEYESFCDRGIRGTYNENGDDYNLCEVLEMASQSLKNKIN